VCGVETEHGNRPPSLQRNVQLAINRIQLNIQFVARNEADVIAFVGTY
jgi:hypothetical protein